VKTVQVPGETVVVEKEVVKTVEVEVPGETVVVKEQVVKTVEVPGQTVTKEVVKTVKVPGETVVVKEQVVKTVEVPGQTVTKEVVKTVPGRNGGGEGNGREDRSGYPDIHDSAASAGGAIPYGPRIQPKGWGHSHLHDAG
jgi:hypothetical protein